MSRLGKKPIVIPDGVTVKVEGNAVHCKGPKGEQTIHIHTDLRVMHHDKELTVERPSDTTMHKSLHGLSRTLLSNAVLGVKDGYKKQLDVQGVGFKAAVQGNKLVLQLGFSHPIEFSAPKGITITMDKENKNVVMIEGADKQLVGETAAKIRGFRKPEPYKGKGIRYVGEKVRRKAGKSAAK